MEQATCKDALAPCYGAALRVGPSHNATNRRQIVKYHRAPLGLKWRYTGVHSADLSGLRALKKFR